MNNKQWIVIGVGAVLLASLNITWQVVAAYCLGAGISILMAWFHNDKD